MKIIDFVAFKYTDTEGTDCVLNALSINEVKDYYEKILGYGKAIKTSKEISIKQGMLPTVGDVVAINNENGSFIGEIVEYNCFGLYDKLQMMKKQALEDLMNIERELDFYLDEGKYNLFCEAHVVYIKNGIIEIKVNKHQKNLNWDITKINPSQLLQLHQHIFS